jgi:hypothetical protein
MTSILLCFAIVMKNVGAQLADLDVTCAARLLKKPQQGYGSLSRRGERRRTIDSTISVHDDQPIMSVTHHIARMNSEFGSAFASGDLASTSGCPDRSHALWR